ncbi:MAG: hypothetical protein CME59_01065 [Halioglobus sp.]|nr:hypothetical protein [Halioglobus sp.]
MGYLNRAELAARPAAGPGAGGAAADATRLGDLCAAAALSPAWTPARERLPQASGQYLVLLRTENYRLMHFDAADSMFEPRSLSASVTHWASLPALPRE